MKSYVLAEKLKMTVHQHDDGTNTCKVESQQPWLLLSRVQMRELRTMCYDAFADFHAFERKQETSEQQDDEIRARAEKSLQIKIRVVRRTIGQQYPTLLRFEASTLSLSEAELNAFSIEIERWASRLEEHDAIGYLAYSNFSLSTTRHLIVQMKREKYESVKPEKRCPALCGRVARDDEDAYWDCWILDAICDPLALPDKRLCPACLEQWRHIFAQLPALVAEPLPAARQEEVWYER